MFLKINHSCSFWSLQKNHHCQHLLNFIKNETNLRGNILNSSLYFFFDTIGSRLPLNG
ncbi:hypothetical protein CPB83DRAFT_863910 [Crepidotus variabilis]|uniref:Uncharacterized protein n=1 Tax=Crepidotus variabilis TaxID=179855 RepID=A0A9P6E5C1_9AGAR|nr:hypothetical protein CPB83DRAFT_863910 [Crepidotus variabilis]